MIASSKADSLGLKTGTLICPLAETQSLSNFKNQLTGCGPFLHNDPLDRNKNLESTTTLHFSPESPSYLLVPIIPEK